MSQTELNTRVLKSGRLAVIIGSWKPQTTHMLMLWECRNKYCREANAAGTQPMCPKRWGVGGEAQLPAVYPVISS